MYLNRGYAYQINDIINKIKLEGKIDVQRADNYFVGIDEDDIYLFTVIDGLDKYFEDDMYKSSVQIAKIDKFDIFENLVKKNKVSNEKLDIDSSNIEIELNPYDIIESALSIYSEDYINEEIKEKECGCGGSVVTEYFSCDFNEL